MANATVRPFAEDDRTACQRIAAAAALTSYGARLPLAAATLHVDAPLDEVDLRLVAIVDDDVAGFIDLTGRNIENLFVDPAVQGRGLGSVLMAAAEEALGAGDLTLAVFTVNPDARRLYERLGFVVESIGAATLSGGEAEVWRMRKRRG
jgi:GNAT superfamily N-acetyltransferase